MQSAARHSAQWYENLTRYIDLPPERMFALLGQRHSPLLPYVPPQLYYHLDRAAGQVEALQPAEALARPAAGPHRARRPNAALSRAGCRVPDWGEWRFTR